MEHSLRCAFGGGLLAKAPDFASASLEPEQRFFRAGVKQ